MPLRRWHLQRGDIARRSSRYDHKLRSTICRRRFGGGYIGCGCWLFNTEEMPTPSSDLSCGARIYAEPHAASARQQPSDAEFGLFSADRGPGILLGRIVVTRLCPMPVLRLPDQVAFGAGLDWRSVHSAPAGRRRSSGVGICAPLPEPRPSATNWAGSTCRHAARRPGEPETLRLRSSRPTKHKPGSRSGACFRQPQPVSCSFGLRFRARRRLSGWCGLSSAKTSRRRSIYWLRSCYSPFRFTSLQSVSQVSGASDWGFLSSAKVTLLASRRRITSAGWADPDAATRFKWRHATAYTPPGMVAGAPTRRRSSSCPKACRPSTPGSDATMFAHFIYLLLRGHSRRRGRAGTAGRAGEAGISS